MNILQIIGAGGHGKVVAETAEACGYSDIRFFDTAWPKRASNGRWSIVGLPQDSSSASRFCAVGDNRTREALFTTYSLSGSPVLVHPSAIISSDVALGAGTLVVAGTIVNSDAMIGQGVILNTACRIDHDCRIGDFVHVSPGALLAGAVTVGARSWIGIGAIVRQGITIGADVMVGAGAVVVNDIPDAAIVTGMPAKPV